MLTAPKPESRETSLAKSKLSQFLQDFQSPPTLEEADWIREALEVRLLTTRSPTRRKARGQFATPSSLAIEMAKLARDELGSVDQIDFLDPALGLGSLYSAVLHVFSRSMLRKAKGFEVDSSLATRGSQIWSTFGLSVSRADFLSLSPNYSASVILANPPYVRHQRISVRSKSQLKKLQYPQSRRLSSLAGLDAHFLLRSHDWLADKGVAVWLVSAQLLDATYGEAIRDYLTHEVTLRRIHRFSPFDIQFNGALVSSVIISYIKQAPSSSAEMEYSVGGSLGSPLRRYQLPINEMSHMPKWTEPNVTEKRAQARYERQLNSVFSI